MRDSDHLDALCRQLQTAAGEVQTLICRLHEVQAEALKDPLTGLLNRRGFEKSVARLTACAEGLRGASVLLADVDRFKQVNDAHGHLLGDRVLCVVAEILRVRTRGSDIATRLGGDEFAVLLPATPLKGAMALAEQIRAAVCACRWTRVGTDVEVANITLTIGIAEAGTQEAAGRNCVYCAASVTDVNSTSC